MRQARTRVLSKEKVDGLTCMLWTNSSALALRVLYRVDVDITMTDLDQEVSR